MTSVRDHVLVGGWNVQLNPFRRGFLLGENPFFKVHKSLLTGQPVILREIAIIHVQMPFFRTKTSDNTDEEASVSVQ